MDDENEQPYRRTRSSGGTAFAFTVSLNEERMKQLFGKPDDVWDPEKGYENEWTFTSADGLCFTVYDRWSLYRVGAPGRDQKEREELAQKFWAWLEDQLNPTVPEEAAAPILCGCAMLQING
jgi:hypothetical protein